MFIIIKHVGILVQNSSAQALKIIQVIPWCKLNGGRIWSERRHAVLSPRRLRLLQDYGRDNQRQPHKSRRMQ